MATVRARGITLKNVEHYGDEPAAEFFFMRLVALARGTSGKQWRDNPTELMGKTIGIIGLGALGQAMAHLALAYKMHVAYTGPSHKPEWEQQEVQYLEKSELLANSDIVLISSPTNTVVIEAQDFEHIKQNAILVQASVGNCFDRQAFLDWVAKPGNFAVFDYTAGNDNYLAYKDLPNVVFPKIYGAHTHETKQRLGNKVFENLNSYLAR